MLPHHQIMMRKSSSNFF